MTAVHPGIPLDEATARSWLAVAVEEARSGLAEHADVDGIDLTGAPPARAMELERMAAGTIKRVVRPPAAEPDWTADPGLTRMTPFLETKTVWHPMGV